MTMLGLQNQLDIPQSKILYSKNKVVVVGVGTQEHSPRAEKCY